MVGTTNGRRAESKKRARAHLLAALAVLTPPALLAQSAGSSNPERWYNADLVHQGETVFSNHCASCHGARAEGTPDWHRRDSDGKFPPPPLDGSAHAWHHPVSILMRSIMEGSPGGFGNMLGFKGKLTPDETTAAIAYFQSFWPDQIYAAWHEIQRRSQ